MTRYKVLGCLAGLLLALTGCSDSSSPSGAGGPHLVPLGDPGKHHVGVGMSKVKPGREVSFGAMILCLDAQGQVTVDGVKPVDPEGGIQIDQFGVRPSPFWKHKKGLGVYKGDLEHNRFHAGRTVDVTCDLHTGRGYELAVAVSMPDRTQARMSGVEVTYTSGGQQRSVEYPLTMYLCPGQIRGERSCRADQGA